MIRLVLDTNVLVSALIKAGGAEARVADLVAAGAVRLCVSNSILDEYREVLVRPKFDFDRRNIEAMLREFKRSGVLVSPPVRISVSRHEADNRFLECAEAANAEFLVTGNKRHFPTRWGTTLVVNAGELTRLIGSEAG